MLLSLNAYSQSYLILGNGVTLTTDNEGNIYDFNQFRAPYKVSINGGQFHVEDKKLSTVDLSGFLYEKDYKVDKIKGKGLNFFVKSDYRLVTIDSQGFYYDYGKDEKLFRKAINYGGNFFLIKPNSRKPQVDLYTVNDKGNYYKMDVEGLNPADIVRVGGRFFQTKDGVTYTVSREGYVYSKAEIPAEAIVKAGGNYFIDSMNRIYTVTDDGLLILPILPANLVVSDIQNLGSNYMIDSEGRIFTVDSKGNMSERTVNHDLINSKVLSL